MNKTLIAAAASALTAAALTRWHARRSTLNALYWQAHCQYADQLAALRGITDHLADQLTATDAVGEDLRAVLNHIQQWDPPR